MQWRTAPKRRSQPDDLEGARDDRLSLALFTLQPGDLIFSGTPAGVGAVKRGDHLKGGVDKVGEIELRVI